MTERLRDLLQEEADLQPVPPPPVATILARGRAGRRRRHLGQGVAAVAVVAAVVAGATALRPGADDADPAPASPRSAPAAYGVGSAVVLGDEVVEVPDTVHSLHYTAPGVLVRSNPNSGSSDGSGPESLTLVREDGTTASLGTVPEGAGPATDPEESVYVLAEERDGGFVAVVRDAATGEEVEVLPLPDLPASYWPVPPLFLDGKTLYVGYRESTVAVDLGSGETRTAEGLGGGMPEVYGGRVVRGLGVVDALTGESVFKAVGPKGGSGRLSPDGAYLQVSGRPTFGDQGMVYPDTFTVYDLATGEGIELPTGAGEWGWTSGGRLVQVDGERVTTCDPGTGECAESAVPSEVPAEGDLKLGGRVYES